VNYTEELARFIVHASFEGFPREVIEVAKKCLLDWIGVALGAVEDPGVRILKNAVLELGRKKQASIMGYGSRTTIVHAALVNGMMAHTLDYDDAHSVARTHPSAPLIPALLAVAEHGNLSGRDLIVSFIVGCEATLRIGYGLGRAYYEKGWHSTSILGRFGAAAGVSRLLGLGEKETAVALGLAATQAGGLREVFGTMGKPFHAGKAAMDGLLAALLAQKGFSAPTDILSPESGFGRVFSSEYDPHRIVRGLGTEYPTAGIHFKAYAACLLVHPVIDAFIALRREHQLEADSVEEIDIRVAPLNLQVTDNPEPEDGMEAKFSLHMAAVLALMYGGAPDSLFTDAMVKRPAVKAMMKRVKAFPDSSLAETEAKAKVVLKDGRDYSIHVATPKGDPGNPLTFDEVAVKAKGLVKGALPNETVDRIVGMVKNLEELDNVAKLVKLCSADKKRGKPLPKAVG